MPHIVAAALVDQTQVALADRHSGLRLCGWWV
ncbi:hypothetical protein [Lactiplantibacillus plantarum]